MGLCWQQGGSLSLDSMHIMCVCVCMFLCMRAIMSVCICGRVLVYICAHVQRHCVSVYGEGMATESL